MATCDQPVAAVALDDGRRGLQPEQPDRVRQLAHLVGVGRPGVVAEVDLVELDRDHLGHGARAGSESYHDGRTFQ
jgi:hypothetical protein